MLKENVCGLRLKASACVMRYEDNGGDQKVLERDEQQSDHDYDDDHGGLDDDESDTLVQWNQ